MEMDDVCGDGDWVVSMDDDNITEEGAMMRWNERKQELSPRLRRQCNDGGVDGGYDGERRS